MADIKINVKAEADFGGVSSAMDVINQKAAKLQETLGKPVNIAVENSDALSKIKAVGQADEEAKRRVSGAPASSTSDTPEEIVSKRKQRQVRELSEEYKKHYGQKREFNELDLKAHSAAIHRMSTGGGALGVYAQASGGDPRTLSQLSPAASKAAFSRAGLIPHDPHHAGGSPPHGGMIGGFAGKLGAAAMGMGGGMLAGGAGGGGMGAAGSAIGGMIGSIGGPIGAMVGGALGGALFGAVGGAMGGATKEAVSTSDLRASMGALSVDFDQLTATVKTVGNGLGIMSEETVQLASRFSKSAGLSPDKAGQIGSELKNAIGFSRGYGLDPSQGTDFFATMRKTGAANDDSSNRKLGSVISESIVRSGNLSKTDEVLAAVGNFASMTARLTLNRPNVEGFSSALSNLTMGHRSGLDVQGAAALIQNMDSGYRGNKSQQGANVRLGAYQQAYGGADKFNALDATLMQEQGIYGTYRDALNSKLKTLKGDNKDDKNKGEIAAVQELLLGKDKNVNLDKTGGQAMVEFLQKQTAGDPSMQRKAFAHQFGISESQAGEVMKAMSGSRGGERAKQLGNMPAVNQPMAFQILGEKDPAKLAALAGKFISGEGITGSLGSGDKKVLQGQIDDKDAAGLKNSLMKILQRTEVSDEGTQLRETTASVGQAVNNFAAKLLPVAEFIKSGILALVNAFTGSSEGEFEANERKKIDKKLDVEYDKTKEGKESKEIESRLLSSKRIKKDLRGGDADAGRAAITALDNQDAISVKRLQSLRRDKNASREEVYKRHGVGTTPEKDSSILQENNIPSLLGSGAADGQIPAAGKVGKGGSAQSSVPGAVIPAPMVKVVVNINNVAGVNATVDGPKAASRQ